MAMAKPLISMTGDHSFIFRDEEWFLTDITTKEAAGELKRIFLEAITLPESPVECLVDRIEEAWRL